MPSAEFTDSNILLYSYDVREPEKRATARRVIERLWADGGGLLSTQVLAEFYVVATKKMGLAPSMAQAEVETYREWCALATTVEHVAAAIDLSIEHTVSFWDALIVVCAQAMGARILWSEDLQHGRRFGELEVRNPFI